jgi:hypothetical protein
MWRGPGRGPRRTAAANSYRFSDCVTRLVKKSVQNFRGRYTLRSSFDLSLDSKLCRRYGIARVDHRRGAAAIPHSQSRRSPEIADQPLPDFVPLHLCTEWTAIAYGRRNFLLAGAQSAVDAMLASMRPYLRAPIALFTPIAETQGALPAEGTLILPEIGDLEGTEQVRLLAWIDQLDLRDPVQIVSTTSRRMVPLLESGAFRAELYYRLNVVRIDLESAADLNG